MNKICSDLKILGHRTSGHVCAVLAVLLLSAIGVCASDLAFQYNSRNELTEADYPNGITTTFTQDAAGNRLSEAVGLISSVMIDAFNYRTIQYKVLRNSPLLYAPAFSSDMAAWSDMAISFSVASIDSSYSLYTATDSAEMTATTPRYAQLQIKVNPDQNPTRSPVDTPLLPIWAAMALCFTLAGAGLMRQNSQLRFKYE